MRENLKGLGSGQVLSPDLGGDGHELLRGTSVMSLQ